MKKAEAYSQTAPPVQDQHIGCSRDALQAGIDQVEQVLLECLLCRGDIPCQDGHQVAVRYVDAKGEPTQEWPANPNGSPGAVAGICDPTGRLFGLMPHPDAYLYPFQHPQWSRRRYEEDIPDEGAGLAIFRNGVDAAVVG